MSFAFGGTVETIFSDCGLALTMPLILIQSEGDKCMLPGTTLDGTSEATGNVGCNCLLSSWPLYQLSAFARDLELELVFTGNLAWGAEQS